MGTLQEDEYTLFYHTAVITSWNEKCFRKKLYRKSKHVFMFNTLFPKIVPFMIQCKKIL
jgi:hypothetical protein